MGRGSGNHVTHENEGCVEVLVVLLDIVHLMLHRLPLVHGVEVESRIVSLDGLEESLKGILEAAFGQRSATKVMRYNVHTTLDRFPVVGTLFDSSHPSRRHPWVMRARVQSANGNTTWVKRVSILAQLDEVVHKLCIFER